MKETKKKNTQKTRAKKTYARRKTKTSNNKKLSKQGKKTYAVLGLTIFLACAVLFLFSFVLIPKISQSKDKLEIAETNKSTKPEKSKREETELIKARSKNDIGKNLVEKQSSQKFEKTTEAKTVDQTEKKERKQQTLQKQNGSKQTPETFHKTKNIENKKAKTPTSPSKPKNTKTAQKPETKKSEFAKASPSTADTVPKKTKTPKKSGYLFFVFDDAGHNVFQLEKFLKLPFKCSIAVLPGLAKSKIVSQKIQEAGHDLMLHQPMQAVNVNLDPGPKAITANMPSSKACSIIEENINEIGPVVATNNHEGSLITADYEIMKSILALLKEKNILFLDSRTNVNTQAPKAAKELAMPILERNIFLDNCKEEKAMRKQIEAGMEYAAEHGKAILIGHIFTPELADLLQEMYPEILARGFVFKKISEYFKN